MVLKHRREPLRTAIWFENDVKTYAKLKRTKKCYPRLRMMYNLIS